MLRDFTSAIGVALLQGGSAPGLRIRSPGGETSACLDGTSDAEWFGRSVPAGSSRSPPNLTCSRSFLERVRRIPPAPDPLLFSCSARRPMKKESPQSRPTPRAHPHTSLAPVQALEARTMAPRPPSPDKAPFPNRALTSEPPFPNGAPIFGALAARPCSPPVSPNRRVATHAAGGCRALPRPSPARSSA